MGINLHSHTKLWQEEGAVTTQQVQGKIQKNQGKLVEHMGNHMQCREGKSPRTTNGANPYSPLSSDMMISGRLTVSKAKSSNHNANTHTPVTAFSENSPLDSVDLRVYM